MELSPELRYTYLKNDFCRHSSTIDNCSRQMKLYQQKDELRMVLFSVQQVD